MSKSKTVFIVAGEASGDLHAANMAKQLILLEPALTLEGMGGIKMREAGVNVLFDASKLAVLGIVEVLLRYREIKAVLDQIKTHIKRTPPDLLILVDYQEFNQKLAAYAHDLGIKVLFYISPQVWAWRPNRVHKMGRIVDQMAVIFPFETELYEKAGVPVRFTGHPLLDEVKADKNSHDARKQLNLREQTTIGLFPGSRMSEISRLLPILLETAQVLQNTKTELQFVLPLASSIKLEDLKPWESLLKELNVQLIENRTYDVIQACDCIIVASGTATLEIGLFGVPMVILHKVSPVSYFILRRLVHLSHIGLVNIVPGKEIVKEFIQQDARANKLSEEVLRILNDDKYNNTMRNELAKLRELLGGSGGSKNIALLAQEMLQ